MKTTQSDIKSFLSSICVDDLILTVNRRLSNYLRQEYDVLQQQSGLTTWLSPVILPLSRWYELEWQKLAEEKLVLNDAQEALVWEEIIMSRSDQFILNPSSVALQVKETYSLLQNWCINADLLQKYARTETLNFISWLQCFVEICEQQAWIARPTIPQIVNHALAEKKITLPSQRIIFVGFDDFSPIIRNLLDILDEEHEVISWEAVINANSITRVECVDLLQELTTMARWAYHELALNPGANIGCILPNLSAIRNDVARIFTDVFTSNRECLEQYKEPPFNISAAQKFTNYPMVCSALLILKMAFGQLKLDELSYLLRSPFLAGADKEIHKRCLADANLRQSCEQVLNLSVLSDLIANEDKSHFLEFCPIWVKNFQIFYQYCQELPKQASAIEWAKHFSKLLEIFGWPGERILDSNEFQQLQRWQSLLDEFTTLDLIDSSQDYQHALRRLEQLAERILFQPKTQQCPIQILGILESTGIMFDKLWVQGLDNETWPSAANPNPFIPIEIQHSFQMPHVSSEREMRFSQTVTKRFCTSAQQIIFSYCMQQADKPLSPSPLILQFDHQSLCLPEFMPRHLQLFQSAVIENLVDDIAPPIADDTYIRGGTSLFKSQAICPFKAFAEIRLNATSLDHPHFGLGLQERGSLLHVIMAKIWQTLKTHADLVQYAEPILQDLILKVIDEAFENLRQLKPITLQSRFLAIERQRLKKLVLNWLAYEKNRSSFTVKDCELRLQAQIFGIEVSLQIDRIDELADGKFIIIDYKTGKTSFYDWFGDRPTEPQLPLYCISSEHPIAGIAFAQVRADQMQFRGITAQKNILPDVSAIEDVRLPAQNAQDNLQWPQLMAEWKKNLENLSKQFRAGIAKVDPKDPIKSCSICHLQELCRVHSEYFTLNQENHNDGK